MLQKNQIIELIENTGMFFYDEELTKKAIGNKGAIKFLGFKANKECFVYDKLYNLTIPLSISIKEISNLLKKIYKIFYTNIGRLEFQREMRALLGIN